MSTGNIDVLHINIEIRRWSAEPRENESRRRHSSRHLRAVLPDQQKAVIIFVVEVPILMF